MFKIGQILTKENYTQGAIWCNQNGAHIEKQADGRYLIAENLPVMVSDEARVAQLELQYNLPRPVRTVLLLAREAGQKVDEVLMERVDKIEELAIPLRGTTPPEQDGPATEDSDAMEPV